MNTNFSHLFARFVACRLVESCLFHTLSFELHRIVDQRVAKLSPPPISHRSFQCYFIYTHKEWGKERKHWNLHSDGTVSSMISSLIWAANRTMQINAEMHSTAKKKKRGERPECRIITSRTHKIILDVSVNNKWSHFWTDIFNLIFLIFITLDTINDEKKLHRLENQF